MSLTANMRAPSSTLGNVEHEGPLRMILTVRHPADPDSPDHGQDSRPVNGIAAHHMEMTMNKWIKRVSTAVASTALAGGALLGVSGTASAATASAPGEHTQSAITAFAPSGDRADGYQSAHHQAQDDSWGAPRGWYTNDDRQGHYGEERWNGSHAYVWNGYRWDEATTWYRVSAERWHLDQVAWYADQR
jgi:hypothetical protein